MVEIGLYGKISKGGEADTVKKWLDGFIYGQVWDIFNRLAGSGPDHIKLLEVQAEAKVVLSILAELDTDKLLAKDAEIKLAKIVETQTLPR